MARILIVEDDTDARQLIIDIVENMGHDIAEAINGLDGVRLALTHTPALIILDLMMPMADGKTALEFMRGTPELKDIPVLVVSAHTDGQQIASEYEAAGYMSKPIQVDRLAEQIAALLNTSKQISTP